MNRIAHIDGLRAVAVLAVLIYHFGLFPLSGGFIGVDVFFVISGYLITRKIVVEVETTGQFNFGRFYIGRAKRLFPAMFVTLAASAILAALLLAPEHLADFGASLVYAIMSASNFYFWSQAGYFDTAAQLKPLLHTWSLGVEEQYYLLWPAALVTFLIFGKAKLLPALLLVLAMASLYANYSFEWSPDAIFYLAPFRFFEFAIGGALVAVPVARPLPNWAKEILVILGIALIAYSAVVFNETTAFPYLAVLAPCLGAAMVIYAGEAVWAGAILRNRVSVGLGLISYSLYLVHWPLLVFYQYFRADTPLTTLELWALSALAIAVAALMYLYIEQPTRRPKRLTNSAYGLICAGLALLLMFPGASMWGDNGWMWRIHVPDGDIAAFVRYGGGEGRFHILNYGGADCAQPQCSFGLEGDEKFAVIGDSHGQMFYYGLTKLNPDAPIGFRVFERGACNFVTEAASCDAKTDAAAFIGAGSVSNALLSQSWMRGNYETEYFGRPQAQWRSDPAEFAAHYLPALQTALTTGYLSGLKHLVVVGEVPQFAGQSDAVTCLTRPNYFHEPIPCAEASFVQYPELLRFREFNRLMAEGIRQMHVAPEVTFLDPFDALCDDRFCRQIEDGRLIYSDDDHLSLYGSDLVVSFFQQALIRNLSD